MNMEWLGKMCKDVHRKCFTRFDLQVIYLMKKRVNRTKLNTNADR